MPQSFQNYTDIKLRPKLNFYKVFCFLWDKKEGQLINLPSYSAFPVLDP